MSGYDEIETAWAEAEKDPLKERHPRWDIKDKSAKNRDELITALTSSEDEIYRLHRAILGIIRHEKDRYKHFENESYRLSDMLENSQAECISLERQIAKIAIRLDQSEQKNEKYFNALKEISVQPTYEVYDPDHDDVPDFEYGYNECVRVAKEAIK